MVSREIYIVRNRGRGSRVMLVILEAGFRLVKFLDDYSLVNFFMRDFYLEFSG